MFYAFVGEQQMTAPMWWSGQGFRAGNAMPKSVRSLGVALSQQRLLSRLSAADPRLAFVVVDSRVVVHDSVALTKELLIKGTDFSTTYLVMDTQLGARFANAAVASFRLSPQDYHRYHSPVIGTVKGFGRLPGDYYQV